MKSVPTYLKMLSDAVDKEVVKKCVYNESVKNVNDIDTMLMPLILLDL